MLRIFSFLKKLLPTWRHIKAGALVVIIAGLLNSTASFHLMLAAMLFAIFFMYLYIDSLNQQIIELKAQSVRPEPVEPEIHRSSPQIRGSQATLDTSIGFDNHGSLDSLTGHKLDEPPMHKDMSNLLFRLQQLEEQVNHQNSEPKPDFEGRIEELSSRIRSLSNLECRISDVQQTCKFLVDTYHNQIQIEKHRQGADQKVVGLLQQFDQKLVEYFQQSTDLSQIEQRIGNLEWKMKAIPDFNRKALAENERYHRQEAMIKDLANSVVLIGESLNKQVSGLYEILERRWQIPAPDNSRDNAVATQIC